jgi:hypothetical protein
MLTVYICTVIVTGPPVIDRCEWHKGQVYETDDDCAAAADRISDRINDEDHKVQTFECTHVRFL